MIRLFYKDFSVKRFSLHDGPLKPNEVNKDLVIKNLIAYHIYHKIPKKYSIKSVKMCEPFTILTSDLLEIKYEDIKK
jgi:hypothetical protein